MGQNERTANYGTSVESCSKNCRLRTPLPTATIRKVFFLPLLRWKGAVWANFSDFCLQRIHGEKRQKPKGRLPFVLPTTPNFSNCQTKRQKPQKKLLRLGVVGIQFFVLIAKESDSILGCCSLDYPSAQTGGAVNSGLKSRLLAIDWLGWLCCVHKNVTQIFAEIIVIITKRCYNFYTDRFVLSYI